MKYSRILLKLSGESLQGEDGYGINYDAVHHYAMEIKSAIECDVQVGVVMGGGNIFRGVKGADKGFFRTQGDYMGMLATIINSMALQAVLEEYFIPVKLLSSLPIEGVCEKTYFKNATQYLAEGYVVIFAAGTGNPFFTTDSAAALRAAEINAELLLKGTRVDGVYSADPEKDPDAVKYNVLTFAEALEEKLAIMDLTAFTLAQENHIPIYVYNANEAGNLVKVLSGENIGTLIN
ncbi:MAG: UMP kinase [Bacteroidetes bacterium]|nr:UMP kinase [Bacteroidota bacterium]MCL2303372.1 UMP kinase [Lentimicrobiaceae bacterium]